jgi:hypothetical protein
VTFRLPSSAVNLVVVRGRRFRLLLVLPLAAVLAGCGATAHQAASQRPLADAPRSVAPRCKTGPAPLGSSRVTVAPALGPSPASAG